MRGTAMTEERWIDKVSLKKRWGIDEAGLVKMVLERIITPYGKNQDGKYYLMPFKREVITRETKRRPSRWGGEGEPFTSTRREWLDMTKEEIAKLLKAYVWFRQIEIDDAEYESKIKVPEKPQEETKITSLSEAGQKGGYKPKKNRPIIEALRLLFKEDPTLLDLNNEKISNAFTKKYSGESKACKVEVDGDPWEIYHEREFIIVRPRERYDGKPSKRERNPIKLDTFRHNYIPDVKESIRQKRIDSLKKI
jgi:hypothetical protein